MTDFEFVFVSLYAFTPRWAHTRISVERRRLATRRAWDVEGARRRLQEAFDAVVAQR